MEALLVQFARWSSHVVEAVAVLVVVAGSIDAFVRLLWIVVTPGATHGERKAIWRRYGMWLLGAIAVIRTFLNYFLEQDLESAEASGEVSVAAR
jgi:uncharacterized membrane protein